MRLQGPESAVTIKLPYAQDFDKRKLTLGEGGVSIEVSDTAVGSDSLGVRRIGIRAQRLALEHEADRIALAGSVTVTTADSVTLTTDSLRWSRSDDLLHVPGWADITRARRITAGPGSHRHHIIGQLVSQKRDRVIEWNHRRRGRRTNCRYAPSVIAARDPAEATCTPPTKRSLSARGTACRQRTGTIR